MTGRAGAVPRRPGDRRTNVLAALAAALLVLLVRGTGPSDLWDQVQPRTIAYTIDLLEHGGAGAPGSGAWILPREHADVPATKPPLYNWLAAPVVRTLGRSSELAHRMPSVLAFLAASALLAAWATRREGADRAFVAALAFPCSYAMAKLGWLARPDMLIVLGTLLCTIGTVDACVAPGGAGPGADAPALRARRRGPWLVLAGGTVATLAKGPAVLPALLLAPACVLAVRGRRREVVAMAGAAAGPLAAWGLWLLLAWRIDPVHVREVLLGDELLRRVAGTNPDAASGGAGRILWSLPWMPFYLVTRLLPWSLPALGAAAWCWRRGGDRRHRILAATVIAFVALFSLSAGKRADYVAPVAPAVAVLAAAALVRPPGWTRPGERRRGILLASLLALGTVGGIAIDDRLDDAAPTPDHGRALARIASEAEAVRDAERRATGREPILLFAGTRDAPVASLLGAAVPPDAVPPSARVRFARGASVVVVERIAANPPPDGDSRAARTAGELLAALFAGGPRGEMTAASADGAATAATVRVERTLAAGDGPPHATWRVLVARSPAFAGGAPPR